MKEEFQKLFEKFDKTLSIAEKNMLHEYTTALKDLYDITAKAYRKYEKNGKLTYEEMTRYNRINSFYAQLDEAVNQAYKNNTKIISNSLKDTYKTGYNGVKNIVETHTEKNGKKYLIPIVKDEVLEKSMNNNISGLKWTERMGLHRDTAVLKIRETVTQGLKKGQTYGEMSRNLNDSLSGQVVQPMRIVRTESHRVFSEAKKDSLDVVAKKGLKMTKTWISSRDERVRAQHAAMDGVTIPYEDDFIMPDGAKGFGPGMIGAPQHDIHCRCDWIIDFVDENSENSLDNIEDNGYNEVEVTREQNIKNIKKQEWQNTIKDKDKTQLSSYFDKATDEELKFWDKYGGSVKGNLYDKTDGYYNSGTKTVHLNLYNIDSRDVRVGDMISNRTFFHETGHLFDDTVLRETKGISIVDALPELKDKLKSDYLSYANKLLKENGLNKLENLSLAIQKERDVLKNDLREDMDLKNAVSDIVGGMTNNQIVGGYGHNDAYWLYKDKALEKEAVAHMFEAKMMKGERKEVFTKYFPEAFKYFEEYITKLV